MNIPIALAATFLICVVVASTSIALQLATQPGRPLTGPPAVKKDTNKDASKKDPKKDDVKYSGIEGPQKDKQADLVAELKVATATNNTLKFMLQVERERADEAEAKLQNALKKNKQLEAEIARLSKINDQAKTANEPIPAPKAGESATIRLRTHADAIVTIDGYPTSSTGTLRVYLTPPLRAKSAIYTVAATKGGKVASKDVTVKANETVDVELLP